MNKILIWVGAEISEGYPANLPNTRELVLYMVERLYGKPAMKVFQNRLAQYNALMRKLNHNTSSLIYPDILISQWGRIKAVHVNAGIASFLHTPYNLNHSLLAMLLSKGVSIITTNMDLCIEHAYEALMEGTDSLKRVEMEGGVAIYKGENKDCGTIYHLHGTAEDATSLGGVVEAGKPYFSRAFRDKLKQWMQEEYMLYCCGYDCSDVYDVNMLFYYLEKYLPEIKWSVNVVGYGKKRELSCHLRKIGLCFKKVNLLCEKTNDVFVSLYMDRSGETEAEIRRKVCQMVRSQPAAVNHWQQEIDTALAALEEYKDILLLHINQVLGVPVEEMDAEIYSRLEAMPESHKNMYTSLMFRYSYDLIPIYGYGMPPGLEEQRILGEELLRLCRDEYNIMNERIEMLTQLVDKMQQDYLSALRRKTLTIKWENEAEELLEDIEEILPKEEGGRFLEIPKNNCRDFADLYRLRAAVRAVCYNDETKIDCIKLDLQYSYMYCSQSANWSATLKTLNYASFCYLCFYYKYGKKSFYDKAQQYKTLRKKQESEKS